MQGVLATSSLPGSPYWIVLWDDLRSSPCHRFTVVQETEIVGVWYRCRRSVSGRNSHPDCHQQLDSTCRVCGEIVLTTSVTNYLLRFKWTMRIIALIEFVMLAIANLVRIFVSVLAEVYSPTSLQTLRRRLDPPKHTGPFFAWYDFKKTAFSVYTSGGVLGFLGIYTGKFHLPTPATIVQLT